jgi:hypothetical protein
MMNRPVYLNVPDGASNPTLTVIVPCYNIHHYLKNLTHLMSTLAHPSIKIVLIMNVDDFPNLKRIIDGSTDVNFEVFAGNFSSPGSARNLGMDSITTKWFTFWDADDLPEIGNVTDLLLSQGFESFDLHIGQIEIVGRGIHEESRTDSQTSIQDLAYLPAFTRMIFRSQKFDKFRFPDLLMGEDRVFLSRTNLLDSRINFLDKVLYRYDKSASILTSQFPSQNDSREAIKMILSLIPDSSPRMTEYHISQALVMTYSILRRTRSIRSVIPKDSFKLMFEHPVLTFKILFKLTLLKGKR